MLDGVLETWSYLGIIVVLILTGCGLPVPEEVAIIAAGVLSAADDGLNPYLAFGSCMLGALIGDCIMYYLGRRFGRGLLKEHPAWVGFMTAEREKRIERMIRRHGIKVFFIARFLVGLRGPMYVTAGILHMPFLRFLLIDLFCASIVIGLFFTLSYIYGDWITDWIRTAEVGLTIAVVVIAVGLTIAYAVHHVYHLRKRRREAEVSERAKKLPIRRDDETSNVA